LTALQALILGIVQGLGEFLPISSSGHLVLLQKIFGISEGAMSFDIVVHLGTLVSLLVVMRKEIMRYARHPLGHVPRMLALGTLPTIAIALAFNGFFEGLFESGASLGVGFVLTAALLWFAESRSGKGAAAQGAAAGQEAAVQSGAAGQGAAARGGLPAGAKPATGPEPTAAQNEVGRGAVVAAQGQGAIGAKLASGQEPTVARSGAPSPEPAQGKGMDGITPRDALAVGVAQGIAIVPAISRSGSTIAGGLLRGLSREAAIEYGFLMAIPVTLMAVALDALKMLIAVSGGEYAGVPAREMLIGAAAAMATGLFAAKFMLSMIRKIKLAWFSAYVLALGVFVLADQLWFGIFF
jgi:undecaprenyl pyrophosphate phosphatase UppP